MTYPFTVGDAPYSIEPDGPYYHLIERSQDLHGRKWLGVRLRHQDVKKDIGAVEMWESLWLKDCWAVSYSDLKPSYFGQGLGLALYQTALDEVGAMHQDWEQRVSEEAAWVWSRLSAYATPTDQKVYAIDPGFIPTPNPDGFDEVVVDLLNFDEYFDLTDQALTDQQTIFRTSSPPELHPWIRCAFVTESYLAARGVD